MPSFHGNDKRNDKPHHLYEIKDKQENDTFKFGISCDPINKEKDGLSDSRPSGLGEFDSWMDSVFWRYFTQKHQWK